MADQYSIMIPEITDASFSVNPADMNSKTSLSVTVIEKTIILEPVFSYSGEIYSGEV